MKWIHTERATIERAKELLENRISDLPIWVRWYHTFDNPHGGGASLGISGVEESRGYVQSWFRGNAVPERSAQRIFHAADQILKAGRGE